MNFIVIIFFIFFGWLLKKKQLVSDELALSINHYVIYLCLPAIIFLKIPQLSIDQTLLFPMLMTWMLIPFVFLVVFLLARFYHWSKEVVGCLLLIGCFGNTSFVGFPIIQAFYGEQALAYAVVYDQVGSFLSLAVIGNFFIAKYSDIDQTNNGYMQSTKLFIKKVISFPPFIALVIAFIIRDFHFSEFFKDILSLISITLVPTTMFLVGLHFELKIPHKLVRPLQWVLTIKMFLAPIIAMIVLMLFNQAGLYAQVTFMESAMPPMVTASILAIHAKLAPKLAAAAVGYGLLLSILVMPVIYFLSDLII